MKNILVLLVLFLLSINIDAQPPAHRAPQTIVADVLAMMPAERQTAYNKLIEELIATGEEGVLALAGMIRAPGPESNAQVEYALSGLSHYVMSSGNEGARLVVSNACIKALEQVNERETAAFIIRQLQVVGKDEAVGALSSCLTWENLSGPAARALATIGTPGAIEALRNAIADNTTSGTVLRDIILAYGESGFIADASIEKACRRSSVSRMKIPGG